MKERRSARVGTVSGLALLAGGTAVAAVAGGAHSVFATVLLGMLAVGMGHALLTELQRQARRRNVDGWAPQDTVNTVLLASWAGGALSATLLAVAPTTVRAVGLLLALGYALSCAYFVAERYRTISDPPDPATTDPATAPTRAPAETTELATPAHPDPARNPNVTDPRTDATSSRQHNTTPKPAPVTGPHTRDTTPGTERAHDYQLDNPDSLRATDTTPKPDVPDPRPHDTTPKPDVPDLRPHDAAPQIQAVPHRQEAPAEPV
ncbi:hypothetical protein [Winogradskya humida]|uniref:Uncharacterized protein n=1 Tax=Winogradskya humida TaxID=113566 RepID=A0ABQ3ZNF1_9ACTN|nr:hypothetical protein [Actinoplanes humidus]GIE20067.1 hypothetical protein Ahu01nite_031690 [Actinoplanes humidus]